MYLPSLCICLCDCITVKLYLFPILCHCPSSHHLLCSLLSGVHFGKWSSAMHGIVASRTFSLRILRQKIFSTPLLIVCYTLLGRGAHLMLLDCWRRWKCYWAKRRHWLRARWQFRVTWIQERCAGLFQIWKEFVKDNKARRLEAEKEKAMGLAFHRRGGLVRQPTKTTLMNSAEKEITAEEYEKGKGFANKKMLAKCFAVMNDGAEGKLAMIPSKGEFMTLMKAFWQRPQVEKEHNAGAGAVSSPNTTRGKEQEEGSGAGGGGASSDSDESQSGVELVSTSNRVLDEDSEVFAALAALDLKKLAHCVLSQQEVLPEHIERFCVGLGDKFVPLVALLLARCTPYIAKRVLLGDLKDEVNRSTITFNLYILCV